MRSSVFLSALIVLGAYRVAADVPPPSATIPAQSVATAPKSPGRASNELQDELNQQKQINQQKQQYRKLNNAMKRQQRNLTKQVESESSAPKHAVNPAVANIKTPNIGGSHGAAKRNRKHGEQDSPTKPKMN
jgi:cell shape-determining protein MreC